MDKNQKGLESDVDDVDLKSVESLEAVVLDEESDIDDESQSLLQPKKSGVLDKSEKPRRKVQWLDRNGSQLAQILEFQPSDLSDSDDDDDSDSCICRIM